MSSTIAITIAFFSVASLGTCFGFMICAACVAAKKADLIDDNVENQMEDVA